MMELRETDRNLEYFLDEAHVRQSSDSDIAGLSAQKMTAER
jgi:hypothetical protein